MTRNPILTNKFLPLWLVLPLGCIVLFTDFSSGQEGLDSAERRASEKAELEQWAGKLYRLFKKADTDGDKTLSLLELRNHLDTKMKPESTSKNDLLLKILLKKNPNTDLNQDGLLSKEELVKYLDAFIAEENKEIATP